MFVALELPHEVRAALSGWRDAVLAGEGGGGGGGAGEAGGGAGAAGRGAGELRPVGRDQLHVTLCFLGLCDRESVTAIGRACSVVGGSGGALLRIGAALWLPRRRPGVLAVAVDDMDGKLAAAQAALAQALIQIGAYRAEARTFLPHVTVARVKGRGSVRVRELAELAPPPAVGFEGSRVTLFRSVPGGGGSRYEPLHTVEL